MFRFRSVCFVVEKDLTTECTEENTEHTEQTNCIYKKK